MTYPRAEQALADADPIMGGLVEKYYPLTPRTGREDYFASLARTMVGQQISVKAAAKIFARLVEYTDLSPSRVAQLDDETSKAIGLSGQKRRYLGDLGQHFDNNPAIFNHLENLSDEEVISELTAIKGIGVWTAQMFLLFTLQRPDIFAPDDRGLQLAIERHYIDAPARPRELADFVQRWSPYRSTASLYLWRSLDNTPN